MRHADDHSLRDLEGIDPKAIEAARELENIAYAQSERGLLEDKRAFLRWARPITFAVFMALLLIAFFAEESRELVFGIVGALSGVLGNQVYGSWRKKSTQDLMNDYPSADRVNALAVIIMVAGFILAGLLAA